MMLTLSLSRTSLLSGPLPGAPAERRTSAAGSLKLFEEGSNLMRMGRPNAGRKALETPRYAVTITDTMRIAVERVERENEDCECAWMSWMMHGGTIASLFKQGESPVSCKIALRTRPWSRVRARRADARSWNRAWPDAKARLEQGELSNQAAHMWEMQQSRHRATGFRHIATVRDALS